MPLHEKPKIGYVVKRYPRYSETFIVNEILAHEATGTEIVIFALRGPEDTHFQDIISRVRAPVVYLPDRVQKTSDFWAVLRSASQQCPQLWATVGRFAATEAREIAHGVALAELATKHGITHFHAHFATSATTAARIASRITGIPYTLTAHAKDIFHDSVDDTDLAGKFSDARSVITVSDFNRDFLRTHFPESADKVHRIYNGLDLERFPFSDAYEREPRIVAVGRLVEKKGFADLVKACAELRRTGLDFSCAIVGSGECEQDLRSLAAQLGLQQQVQFLGSRPQREVIEIVQSAAVMAAPCIVGDDGNRDGLPTVILEAMALGTPCVGTDVTGIPEALIDGHSGRCIPQHDVGALASALHAFLTEPLLRRRTARAARTHVEQFFCARRNAAAVRQHFASDIETKKEARG